LRQIVPGKAGVWLNQTCTDFDELVPIINEEHSLFETLSMGSTSSRDGWVFDFDKGKLENKIKYFMNFYNQTLDRHSKENPNTDLKDWVDKKIKWTDSALKYLERNRKMNYSQSNIKNTLFRPFVLRFQYFDKMITHRQRKFLQIFQNNNPNKLICFVNPQNNSVFQTLASDQIVEYHLTDTTQCIPLYMHDDDGKRRSNVNKSGLELLQKHYKDDTISGEDVFYYTYAIFNDPKYSSKYKYDLQRGFPRIPLAVNFREWARIGRSLYDLHVGFEDAEPYPLRRTDGNTRRNETRLLLRKSENEKVYKIIIDRKTVLEGVPLEALEYRFSSKCALEWILEFYKESKNEIKKELCDDPAIRKKYSTYRFADHKEHVIDLLQRVTAVSIETVRLRRELGGMPWGKQPKLHLGKSDASVGKTAKKSQTRKKSRRPKRPKAAKKGRGKPKLQDTLDGAGQKGLFTDGPAA